MNKEAFQLYEKRIDNCFLAAERAKDPHFRIFWYQTAMALVRKMNRSLSSAGLEQLPSKQ